MKPRLRALRLALALGLWLISGLSPVAAQGVRRHVVEYGDTPERLAGRYGVPLAQLLAINGLEEGAVLRVGEALYIPARFTAAEHIVRPGETLAAVAQRYGLSATLLAQHNGLWDRDRLVVGQRLLIPVAVDALPVRDERTLYLAAPRAGEIVSTRLAVRGVGSSPDNLLLLRAHDASGALLAEGWAPVRAEIGQQGAFTADLLLGDVGASEAVTLTVQSHHLHDGSVRERATVQVRLAQP